MDPNNLQGIIASLQQPQSQGQDQNSSLGLPTGGSLATSSNSMPTPMMPPSLGPQQPQQATLSSAMAAQLQQSPYATANPYTFLNQQAPMSPGMLGQ